MVRYIRDTEEKEQIAEAILYNLPKWFGLPESTRGYISESKNMPFWAYFEGETPKGFIVLKETAPKTAEIYVMGVLQDSHRKRIGTALWESFLQYAKNQGYEYVQVKTVQSGKYKEYDITNAFYRSLGFRELEVFPTLWGEANPCQIYVRYIGPARYLYHGSGVSDIRVLNARSKLHDSEEKVVYLTGSVPYALVYIWDAEHIGYDRKHVTCALKGGKVFYEEQFPDQLKTFYKGVSGYLYCVEKNDEFRRVEGRESMFYSSTDAPVSKVVYIEDVYEELMKYEKEGKFQVGRFNEASKEKQDELVQMMASVIEKGNFLEADTPKARFYKKYFKAAWKVAIDKFSGV